MPPTKIAKLLPKPHMQNSSYLAVTCEESNVGLPCKVTETSSNIPNGLAQSVSCNEHTSHLMPLLPPNSVLVSCTATEATIRCRISTYEEWLTWFEEYKSKSQTSWISRSSRSNKTTFVLCKDYVCSHNSLKKIKGSKKDCQCQAKLNVRIKNCGKYTKDRDKYAKDGFLGIVKIWTTHNHTIGTAEALSYLKPSIQTRLIFEEYFSNGMNVSESMKSRLDYLHLTIDKNLESTLASAIYNPKVRTVHWWYDEWRKKNLGSRSGTPMLEVLKRKCESYKAKGTSILFQTEPFAICIVTAVMDRAHELPESSQVVSMDSTANCDSENHSITLMLTPCAAGAVPLAVIITRGQTEEDYSTGFTLLKTIMGPRLFGGMRYPKVFMTDNSTAEKNALTKEWPESTLYLCIFHVMQAVWRWILDSKNSIKKEDRQILMREFQSVVNAYSKPESEILYSECQNSSTAKKYENWTNYIETYWLRKDRWCKAWRDVEIKGHHTNNYCEAAVRIIKDIVLNRCKAFNAVALLDFISNVLEIYYVQRLRTFAHSRNPSLLRLMFEVQLKNSSYIKAKNDIRITEDNIYLVPSSLDQSIFYEVNTELGKSSCLNRKFGRFCKHEAAVYKFFDQNMPNLPHISTETKYKMAVLALGDKAQPISFYGPLRISPKQIDIQPLECSAELQNLEGESRSTEVKNFEESNAEVEYIAKLPTEPEPKGDLTSVFALMKELDKKYGSSVHGTKKLCKRLQNVKSKNQWEAFLFEGSLVKRYKQGSAIRVQPTSLSRRSEGVTRGSKRTASGRPGNIEQRIKKRPRSLEFNINQNQANAKSH